MRLATVDPTVIGILGTLAGVGITGLIGYFLQRDLILRQTRGSRNEDLFQKRLSALQHLLSAIDFIERTRNHNMTDEIGITTWRTLEAENLRSGAFLPKKLTGEFDLVIKSLFSGVDIHNRASIDYPALSAAKQKLLDYLEIEFEGTTRLRTQPINVRRKLNGWHRIGIVLTVVWVSFIGWRVSSEFLSRKPYESYFVRWVWLETGKDYRVQFPFTGDEFDELPLASNAPVRRTFDIKRIAGFLLGLPVAAWVTAYFLVWLIGWVIAGFR